jgi:hypothetical protein
MPKFRLPGLPTSTCDSPVEIADFWEIETLIASSKKASLNNLRATLHRETESDPATDAELDIEEESQLDFAIDEIRYRIATCGPTRYPFGFSGESDRVLIYKADRPEQMRLLYIFLLLVTRMNMNIRRTFNDVDGPLLFEEVCEAALKGVWSNRTKTHRFGTSSGQGNFPNKLKSFFDDLEEFPLRSDREIPNHGGDDGLDIAVWTSFTWAPSEQSNAPRGKLILLAQCKTGTSWEVADLQRLQPDSFFGKWMAPEPCGQTVRAFLASARVDRNKWEDHHRDGGLIFDRCRIFDYTAENLPESVFSKVRIWTEAALECSDLGIR